MQLHEAHLSLSAPFQGGRSYFPTISLEFTNSDPDIHLSYVQVFIYCILISTDHSLNTVAKNTQIAKMHFMTKFIFQWACFWQHN